MIIQLFSQFLEDRTKFTELYREICRLELISKHDPSVRLEEIKRKIALQDRVLKEYTAFNKKWQEHIRTLLDTNCGIETNVPEFKDVELSSFVDLDHIPADMGIEINRKETDDQER